jgi:predicted dehydrogenase
MPNTDESPWVDPPVRVGLVGAGPWATLVHGPVIAEGPETTLAGVWARRREAADELAAVHGTTAAASFEELLDGCDAVAFAVPPDVQAELAVRAARAGKAVLLEKPVALDLAEAQKVADAVGEAGVASAVVFTWRYAARTIEFLDQIRSLQLVGGHGRFISSASLGGMFATPWRAERGPLLDLGPHVVDLLAAAFGPVVDIRAIGDRPGWVSLLLDHGTGAVSTASLCATVQAEPALAGIEVFGHHGAASLDCTDMARPDTFARVRRAFADAVVNATPCALDVQHGLTIQRLITAADDQLR